MKKTSTIIALLSLFFLSAEAQLSYLPGSAILKDGSKVTGLIARFDEDPWYNQRNILIKDSTGLASNPDIKEKKYKADEVQSYELANLKYEKVHFVDLQNLQLKSLGTNDHLLEVVTKGRINAYKFYSYPPDTEGFIGTEAEYKEWKKNNKYKLLRAYKILISKDGEAKMKDAFDLDLQKYFQDTPDVLQKYQTGGYGNEPIVAKKGLGAKLISMAKKEAYKPQETEALIAALNDYNQKNTSKK
jgi:hypothetical protein